MGLGGKYYRTRVTYNKWDLEANTSEQGFRLEDSISGILENWGLAFLG
jgi:hypothetical protein